MKFVGLDIETAPLEGFEQHYALMPWSGKARITSIAVSTVDGAVKLFTGPTATEQLVQFLDEHCKDSVLATWNGVFDIGWLHTAGVPVKNYSWCDVMLLWKWLDNSQRKEWYDIGWSLADGAKRWLQEWPAINQFLALKKLGEGDTQYWEIRNKLDAWATAIIASKCWAELTEQQRRSATIESRTLVPNAVAWVGGVRTDKALITAAAPSVIKEMAEIECRLGVSNTRHIPACYGGDGWTPSTVLRSPKQLAELLYEKWGLPCEAKTAKGAPSTDKKALTYLADQSDLCIEILRWRELNTQLSKFIQSPLAAIKFLESDVLHPSPRIFGTYTGRYTYSSKVKNHPVSMALHQMPRNKVIRKQLKAPAGKLLVEFDASGQEARLVAEVGHVETMQKIFKTQMDYHSSTGATIGGIDYATFIKAQAAGEPAIVGEHGLRYCGKFVNLSNQYRVGTRKCQIMARVQYGLIKDFYTIKGWQDAWHNAHPGIKKYWATAIARAKDKGYAETLAGRRFYIHAWDDEHKWTSESSAINFPIQGSGADMKELALATVLEKLPELQFAFDLHDGLFFYADANERTGALIQEAKHVLETLDYAGAWGWQPSIPMPWDAAVGFNWGEMRKV